jgi:hypothetical protein
MRERASMTAVSSIRERRREDPLATVGKPYKLPGWKVVSGDILTLNRTLPGLGKPGDSTWI